MVIGTGILDTRGVYFWQPGMTAAEERYVAELPADGIPSALAVTRPMGETQPYLAGA